MKRHQLAGLAAVATAFAITLGASDASAQTPNQPPPTPTQPPSATPTQPPPPSAAAAAAPNAVRLHITTEKNKGKAHIYIHRADGTWPAVCSTPCTADVPVNSELRAVYNDYDDDPHTFTVTGELGPEVDLEVKPASIGALIGGIVMMGAGGAFVLSGLLFLALADVNSSLDQTTSSSTGSTYKTDVSSTYKTFGYVCIGVGAAAAVGGLILLLTRSHEPRTFDKPYRPTEAYGRESTFLSDVAAAKRQDPTTLKPAFAPLTYTFSF